MTVLETWTVTLACNSSKVTIKITMRVVITIGQTFSLFRCTEVETVVGKGKITYEKQSVILQAKQGKNFVG